MNKFSQFLGFPILSFILLSSDEAHGNYANSPSQQLCNLDGIHKELLTAVEMLKRKSVSPGNSPYLLRQDDDDDDLPYYVPAIAKVVGSVLAANATNIIEESFGFIPPEINKNIRYVINLVADTVAKLRPTPAPTEAAVTQASATQAVGNETTVDPLEGIEGLLAYAIAQEVEKTLNAASTVATTVETPAKTPETDLKNSPKVTDDDEIGLSSVAVTKAPTTAELFSTTFKYSEGQSITSAYGGALNGQDDISVYAPAYAPNYGVSTTKIPQYAPAFGHNEYTTLRTTVTPVKTVAVVEKENATTSITTEDPESVTDEETVGSSTTEEEYEEPEDAETNETEV